MLISKTIFKEYSRCPRVAALDDVYRNKLNSSLFDGDYERLYDILGSMFDLDSGENLVDVVNPQLEALLPYYNKLEEYAIRIAKEKFGDNIKFSLITKEQKSFVSYIDSHTYITYLDGFQEKDDVVRVFEVKATTSRKFNELGTSVNKKKISIFDVEDNVLKIKSNTNILAAKFAENYEKLFDRYNEVGKYVFDIAVERFIIENSLEYQSLRKKKFEYYLIVLNKDYVYDGTMYKDECVYNVDINGNQLVTFVDLTDVTREYQKQIAQMNVELLKFINKKDENEYPIGRYCERKSQNKCAFVKTCWKDAEAPGSIFEYLQNHLGFVDDFGHKHSVFELYNSGKRRIDSIPTSWLSKKNNLIQRDCFDFSRVYSNKEKLEAGLKVITYPLYHLDFETFPSPLPRFKGENPYNQSVFQFSLHIEKTRGKCDINTDHYHYLPMDNSDHREELIQKLVEYINLDNGGTVIVYNKAFEHTRIKELMKIYPKYKKSLELINDNMFDLMDLVSTRSSLYKDLGFSDDVSKEINYYNNNLHGSYSIKKVLPLFSNLDYGDLDVKNGTEAIAAYASFSVLEEEDREIVYNNLVEYCKQDTWAMVLILWGLYNLVK